MSEKISILNDSELEKTVKALNKAARHAGPKARKALEGLTASLGGNQTAGRARRTKENATMAKTQKRAPKAHHTTPKATAAPRKSHARVNPTGSASGVRARASRGFERVKKVDFSSLIMNGVTTGAGMAAQSFAQRQVQRIMPSLSPMVCAIVSGGVVAGAAMMAGGGSKWAESAASGAIAQAVLGIAREAAPGVFAGIDGTEDARVDDATAAYVAGYEDARTAGIQGAVDEPVAGYEDGIQGLTYAGQIPSGIANRPAGL